MINETGHFEWLTRLLFFERPTLKLCISCFINSKHAVFSAALLLRFGSNVTCRWKCKKQVHILVKTMGEGIKLSAPPKKKAVPKLEPQTFKTEARH